MSQIQAVILAAGKGTRMKSSVPKILHSILGKPMVQYVINACQSIGVDKPILVIGHGADQVREVIGDQADYTIQREQLGTGHAVLQAEEPLKGFKGDVLVVCGDTPIIQASTLASLLQHHREHQAYATAPGLSVLTGISVVGDNRRDPTGGSSA